MSRAAFLALLSLAACNADEEFVDAVPTTDQVSLKIPARSGQTQQASADGVQSSALVGATAELYEITWGVAATVNAGTALTVGALRLITLQAPTSRTSDSRTWGPFAAGGLDPLTYRLIVRKLGAQHFGFSLEASSRLAADPTRFLPLIDGEVTRGPKVGTGQGTMVVHFDDRRTLVPDACETGTIAFAFDNTGATVTNDVVLTGFANANDKSILCQRDRATDATYRFQQDRAGAGSLRFSFDKDMVKPAAADSAEETVTVRSRWQATGAGRSDVLIEGGDVASELGKHGLVGPVTASQCWDALFRSTYETSSPPELEIFPTAGDASTCAFTTADLPQ